jgi:hypothetical protein
MKKVRRGDPISIKAADFNAFIDAAEAHKKLRRTPLGQPAAKAAQAPRATVLNDSGETLPRFGVLGIDGPAIGPDDNLPEFQSRLTLRGVAPAEKHAGRFVVLTEPLAHGEIGRGVVSGLTVARVRLDDLDHDHADIEEDETECLVSSESGAARLLWVEEGATPGEEVWAVILIGGGSGGNGGGEDDPRGQWIWFRECLDCLGAYEWDEGESAELAHQVGAWHLWRWYPVPAGTVRRVSVLLESALGCESVFAFRPVKRVRGEGSPCPDTLVAFDDGFEATVDAEGNTALSAEFTDAMLDAATEPPVLADGDWLGCRVVLKARDPGGVILGPDPLVTVGVYLEASG